MGKGKAGGACKSARPIRKSSVRSWLQFSVNPIKWDFDMISVIGVRDYCKLMVGSLLQMHSVFSKIYIFSGVGNQITS